MNKFYIFLAAILLTTSTFAQAPEKMSYQAVIRNSSDALVTNQAVGMRISILQTTATGAAVYVETQTPTTNINGLVSLEIGTGTPVTGTFAGIDWAAGSYFIKTEIDVDDNASYDVTGTSQLMSVPYALYADNGMPSGTAGTMLYSNGTDWVAIPAGTNGQTLTITNGVPTWATVSHLPTLTTTTPSNTLATTATAGGNITSDGLGATGARGVCWSTSPNPTTVNSFTSDGTGTGTFTSNITGLTANTTYYIRAYATNSSGTAYGNEINFTTLEINVPGPIVTDIDGNVYETVGICYQTWTKTNLNVTKYRNGDVIPQVTDPTAWAGLTTGAWCYYNNDPTTEAVYGKLYNWHAVNDPRGLAPAGYHIPTDAEWTTLTTCLGGETVAGGAMKETGTTHWITPNTDATNSSGFTGLPEAYRTNGGSFAVNGYYGNWWSSTENATTNALQRGVRYNNGSVDRSVSDKRNGFSVRCLRD